MNTVVQDQRKNHLIANLWPTEHDDWLKHLQPAAMPVGQVLFETGGELRHLHFPTTAVVSLTTTLENGASTETAVVGRDGVIGESTLTGAVVLLAGNGFSIPPLFYWRSSTAAAWSSTCCFATRRRCWCR